MHDGCGHSGMTTPEGGPIRTRAKIQTTLPAMRALSRGAGALLAAGTGAAGVIVILALIANARAAALLPGIAPFLWAVAGLGMLQICGSVVIWRIFANARGRFAERLQAATGSLDDEVFLAAADGTLTAVLDKGGWTPRLPREWIGSIHPEDRSRWPLPGAAGAQRIELRLKDANGGWRWHRLRATPRFADDGSVQEWVGTLHDIHDQKLASEHRELVIGELRHRLKNLLTVIEALAKNSRKPEGVEPGVESFLQRYLGRMRALGTAGDVFLAGNSKGVDVATLFETTLAPFKSETAQRIRIAGPPVHLPEESAANFGLAVHELATNALKYGALSVPEGRISLTWAMVSDGDGEKIVFEWKEYGGPPPAVPATAGFGMRMIKHVAAREKNARVDIDYPRDGLTCRIAFEKENGEARGDAR